MQIKFCGIRHLREIYSINVLKPDFIGFVFAKSKREITPKQAYLLKQHLDSAIKAIGVFVNAPLEQIITLVESKIIDGIQLHGEESEAYIAFLKKHTNALIIKAYKMQDTQSLMQLKAQTQADFILLDSIKAGSGVSFSWKILENLSQEELSKPYFLAGGITLHNIYKAMALKPFCLDVSSGIESNGEKDFTKMQEMIKIIKRKSL